MLTPQEWNEALSPDKHWNDRYATVAREARTVLLASVKTLSTTELADILYPPQFMRGDEGMRARRCIFKALLKNAEKALFDCATRGPEKRNKFGTVRPWRWHAPDPTKVAYSGPWMPATMPIPIGGEFTDQQGITWKRLS